MFYPDGPALKAGKKRLKQKPEPLEVRPETGMLLLHRHGHDCMLHEAREVLDGEKWVIRTDLCVQR